MSAISDPAKVDLEAWKNREKEGILFVPRLERCCTSKTTRTDMNSGKSKLRVHGVGLMGHMLALNMERNGFRVAGST